MKGDHPWSEDEVLVVFTVPHVLWCICVHAVGSNGMMFSGLVAGSHSVSVEARSLCNQSERVQKSFGISVPGRVRIDNVRGEYLATACYSWVIAVVFYTQHSVLLHTQH